MPTQGPALWAKSTLLGHAHTVVLRHLATAAFADVLDHRLHFMAAGEFGRRHKLLAHSSGPAK